jgi:hypothetical protein
LNPEKELYPSQKIASDVLTLLVNGKSYQRIINHPLILLLSRQPMPVKIWRLICLVKFAILILFCLLCDDFLQSTNRQVLQPKKRSF